MKKGPTSGRCCQATNFYGLLLLLLLATNSCHSNGDEEPASRMIVFRDVPKGLEMNQPQHLIIRTGYPGSVEFIESNEFRIEVNITAPSVDELANVHFNYTNYHRSMLLQLFDVPVEEAGVTVVHFVLLAVAGVAALSFCGSLVFVCWWNACRRQNTLHTENKTNCPDSSQAPLLEGRPAAQANPVANSTNKCKNAQTKAAAQQLATDESCVSSEDDLNDEGRSATSLSPSTLPPSTRNTKRGDGLRSSRRERPMELESMMAGHTPTGRGSPARSDCPSDERPGSVTSVPSMRMDACDGGCGKQRPLQYVQQMTADKFPTGTGSLRLRRDGNNGPGGEAIPDVVRTRPPPPPAEFSDCDYSTISRTISGAKVVQLMEKCATPPPPPIIKHGSERSVTFSPSAKLPADMVSYDTFGKPRRNDNVATEPRYVSVGSAGRRDAAKIPVNGSGEVQLTNGRRSPTPPPPPNGGICSGDGNRLIDEAYGTLGSSSCNTLASGGTASSGSSGSVVTVINAGGSMGSILAGADGVGGSLARRQHVIAKQNAMNHDAGPGGTLPNVRKAGGAGGPYGAPQMYLQTSILCCLATICLVGVGYAHEQNAVAETVAHIRVYAPPGFLRDKPEVFLARDNSVTVTSNLQSHGLQVDKYEVDEPRIADLSVDKCHGVQCPQSCDAGVGACICHNGYRLVGTRCEDIDECHQMEPVCHEFAQCDNLPGSYRCTCRDGYYGDGVHCQACNTPCENGTYEVMPCADSHPKLCKECSKTCMDGYYISAPCGPTHNTVCKPCKTKCGRNEYEFTPCVGALERQCRDIESLTEPFLPVASPNVIFEEQRKVRQVMSYVVQQDSKTGPVTHVLPLKRGSGFMVHVTIKEANLAPLVRAVNHSESNDNEGFYDEVKITEEYCSYPIPEKYQLSLVLHQGITTKSQYYSCGAKRKKRSSGSASSGGDYEKPCVLETGYYLNPREPCETYSKFGRLPPLNTAGWSVLCVAPGRLSDAFGVSSELTDMTTMFVDKTVKCAEQRTNCDACTVNCARSMQSYRGSHRCNITADDADNGESPRLAYCFSCCNKQECSKLCEVYHNRDCQQLRCITGNLAEFVLSPVYSHRSSIFACHIEPVPRYKIYDIEYAVLYKGVVVNDRRLKAQRLYDGRSGHPEKAVDVHNFLKIYFGSEITTKPDLIEGDSLMKSFIAGYYQAKGPDVSATEINTRTMFVRPKTPFAVSSKTWRRETCDTDSLTQLVNASGSPPDSDPFRPDAQLEVQFVSRGTYRLFNKTQSHLPFIYFELPSHASLLRNSGIYDATTVRDDTTLRADLIRHDAKTWILHVAGELLRCPGSFGLIVRDPGYPSQPLFDVDVGVTCPAAFSIDFSIPTEGADNYDKTILVDITDSYRTIKVTIFRPALNLTSEAFEFFQSNKSYDGPAVYDNSGEMQINIFSPFVGFLCVVAAFLAILLFLGFITDTGNDKLGSKSETHVGAQHMCFVVCYVTFRTAYSIAVTFTVLVLLIRHFNRTSTNTLVQFTNFVETASNNQRLDIEHIQSYVTDELHRQNVAANQTKQMCEQKLIQLQNQLEDAKQQIRVDNNEDRLVSQVALQYTKLMVLNLTNNINKFKQEFTAYAKKALDRLTRSIVQTSSAIQSSKWLAGAKVIYDAVRTKRAAQGLETKPFMEWAGLDQEVDRLVADLSLKDFPMPNLTEFLNVDVPKMARKPSPIPRASDVVLPRNQWYYQYDKKASPAAPAPDASAAADRDAAKGGIVPGDIVSATSLLAVLIAIDVVWFVHRMARTYTTARMMLYGCPIYVACRRLTEGSSRESRMCLLRCLDFVKNLNLRVMKTEFVPKLVATVTVCCASYVVIAASDKVLTVKTLASVGYFDALVAPVETSYRLARTRVKMNAHRVNKFELPFYEELVNVRAKRYQLLLDMYAEVQRSAAVMHDSEYCSWQRLLKPDELCNCTAVHSGRLSFDGCELPPVLPQPYLRKDFSLHRDQLSRSIVPYINAARAVVMETSHLIIVFVAVLVVVDLLGAVVWIYLKRFNLLKLKPLYEIEHLPASETNHR